MIIPLNFTKVEQSAILDEIIKYIPLAATRLRALQSCRDASSGRSPSAATKAGLCRGDCELVFYDHRRWVGNSGP
ncbi:hypothetical protein Syun_015616 [Stephania yunnanensis]|uniref:Uncharacterized protein n=1 Tax=Stephania yunnanensis TaxID=152371 RepID=A0AAP0PCZ8_9MAGN